MTLLCAGECDKCPFLSCNFHPGFSTAVRGGAKTEGKPKRVSRGKPRPQT